MSKQEGEVSLRDKMAMAAPIDFAMACGVWGALSGDVHETLMDDESRAPFLAVWAMLRYEWADAMMKERMRGQEMFGRASDVQ